MLFAQIIDGELDWMEVFLLLATVLFLVGAAFRWRASDMAGSFVALGLALFSFAFILA